MTRKPPPYRRSRDPFRKAQRAPQIRQPGLSPLAAEMAALCERCTAKPHDGVCCSSHGKRLCHGCYRRTHFVEVCVEGCSSCAREGLPVRPPEWAVRHVGIGVLAYDTEDEARTAAGTAGTLLHWGQVVEP